MNMRVLVDGAVKDFDLETGKSSVLKEVDLDEPVFGDQISFFDLGRWLIKTGIQDESSGPNLTWQNVATGDVKNQSHCVHYLVSALQAKACLFINLVSSPAANKLVTDSCLMPIHKRPSTRKAWT